MSTIERPTHSQRIALTAVIDGSVKLDARGFRSYPSDVSPQALDAAHRRGWWDWPTIEPGAVAKLTDAGTRALQ